MLHVLHFHTETVSKRPENRSKGYQATNNGNQEFLSKKAGFVSLKQARNGRRKSSSSKGNETVLPVFALLFS